MKTEAPSLLSRLFVQWTEHIYENPKWTLSFCMLIVIALLSQLPNIRIDLSTEAMLYEDDPVRVNYDKFKKEFGREDAIILSLPTGGELSNTFLSELNLLQTEIEKTVPYIEKITSLINARYTYGENDDMIVEGLLEGFPNHRWSTPQLTKYVLNQPGYKNRLISADGSHTAIVIQLVTFVTDTNDSTILLNDKHAAESVNILSTIISKHPELDIKMTGQPAILTAINDRTILETFVCGVIATLVVSIFLLFFFRRRSGVILPNIIIGGALAGSLGIMSIIDAPYTLISLSAMALIVGMAVADSVHILALFYREFESSGNKKEAIIFAMGYSAPAVTLTTITSGIGFLSFTTGDLATTSELGIYAATAVFFALFFTITLLPSTIALFNIHQQVNTKKINVNLDAFLNTCAEFSIRFPKQITLATIFALALGVYGTSYLTFSHNPIEAFPDDLRAKIENAYIDKVYDGYNSIEIIIDSGKESGVYQDSFMEKLQKAETLLSNTQIENLELGATYSFLDILRETNKALNNNQDDFYTVPVGKELVAQESLMFELNNAEDLFDVIDNRYSKARISLKLHSHDGVLYERLIRTVETDLENIFGNEATITITGSNALVAESVPRALRTMAKSYVVAAFAIIFVMMIVIRSIKIGAISIIPNILPIVLIMNLLILLGIPIDLSTILVGAIAMGIVVDDSLHYLYHFKNHYLESNDINYAIRKTHTSTGPALFVTTFVFTSCCFCSMLSGIDSVFYFGFSMGMIAILALLADLLIVPALLICFYTSPKAET